MRLELLPQLSDGFGTVGKAIFLGYLQLGKGFAARGMKKDRIQAESLLPARSFADQSIDPPLNRESPGLADVEAKGADEVSSAVQRVFYRAKSVEDLSDPLSIIVPKPGSLHAGSPFQGVDTQPRVIRQSRDPRVETVVARFQECVVGEIGTGFLGGWRRLHPGKGDDLQRQVQKSLPDLAQLAAISRCQQEFQGFPALREERGG